MARSPQALGEGVDEQAHLPVCCLRGSIRYWLVRVRSAGQGPDCSFGCPYLHERRSRVAFAFVHFFRLHSEGRLAGKNYTGERLIVKMISVRDQPFLVDLVLPKRCRAIRRAVIRFERESFGRTVTGCISLV